MYHNCGNVYYNAKIKDRFLVRAQHKVIGPYSELAIQADVLSRIVDFDQHFIVTKVSPLSKLK